MKIILLLFKWIRFDYFGISLLESLWKITISAKKGIGNKPRKDIGGLTLKKYMDIGRLAMRQTNIAFHESLITA